MAISGGEQLHQGHRARLRKRAVETGLQGFEPHEVLELLLTYAIPRVDVNPLAHRLIEEFGSLSAVLDAGEKELRRVDGMGENAAALLSLLPELFAIYGRDRWGEKPVLSSCTLAGAYCVSLFSKQHTEAMAILCLDVKKQLIRRKTLFTGTVDETPVYLRDIAAFALECKAHSVLMTHNHPSGSVEPSAADLSWTSRASEALAPLGIRLEDHIIVAGNRFMSLRSEAKYTIPFPGEKEQLLAAETELPKKR